MAQSSLRRISRSLAAVLICAALATSAQAAATAPGPAGPSGPSGPSSGHSVILRQPGDPAASCDVGLTLPSPPLFGDGGDAVKALSRATEGYIKNCQCNTQECIADALDRYADALAAVAPRLPQRFQDMPRVVAQAAHRVRAARTKAQAVKAIRDAIAVIHKDIALVHAEDPDNQRETRSGEFVVGTLTVASLSLEKAGGL